MTSKITKSGVEILIIDLTTDGKVYDEVMVEIVPGHYLKGVIIEDNQAVISQRTLAGSIDVHKMSVPHFLNTKYLKRKQDKGLTVPQYLVKVQSKDTGNIYKMNGCSSKLASLFYIYHLPNNELAEEIVEAGLATTLDQLFLEASDQKIIPTVTDTYQRNMNDYLIPRASAQNAFQNWGKANRLNIAMVHDYITKKIAGMTAEEARTKLGIHAGTDVSIGLNHYPPSHAQELEMILDVKRRVINRKVRGTRKSWQEVVDEIIDQ